MTSVRVEIIRRPDTKPVDDTLFCDACRSAPWSVRLQFHHFFPVQLCWTCAMDVRNGIERERLQKHEHLDEMERLEAELGL